MKLHEIAETMTPEEIRLGLGVPKNAFKMSKDGVITINYITPKFNRFRPNSKMVSDGHLTIKFDKVTVSTGVTFGIGGLGSFGISDFHSLAVIDLKGMPKYFSGGAFNVGENETIETLIGGPEVVSGNYWIHDCPKLKSLNGMAKKIKGTLNIENIPISSLDYMPSEFVGDLKLGSLPNFKSLIGIEEILSNFNGIMYSDFSNINTGGLGLLLIPHLQIIMPATTTTLPKPFEIIQNHFGKENAVFECQEKLIEAGFEEFAQL